MCGKFRCRPPASLWQRLRWWPGRTSASALPTRLMSSHSTQASGHAPFTQLITFCHQPPLTCILKARHDSSACRPLDTQQVCECFAGLLEALLPALARPGYSGAEPGEALMQAPVAACAKDALQQACRVLGAAQYLDALQQHLDTQLGGHAEPGAAAAAHAEVCSLCIVSPFAIGRRLDQLPAVQAHVGLARSQCLLLPHTCAPHIAGMHGHIMHAMTVAVHGV